MGMPGNMNNLMKQAQKMQRQAEENQKALEERIYCNRRRRSRGSDRFRQEGDHKGKTG